MAFLCGITMFLSGNNTVYRALTVQMCTPSNSSASQIQCAASQNFGCDRVITAKTLLAIPYC